MLQKAEAGGFPFCGPGAGVLGVWLARGEAYGSCTHGNPGLVGHIYLFFTTLYLEIISVSEKLQDKNRTKEACFTRLPMCCTSCAHSVSAPGFSPNHWRVSGTQPGLYHEACSVLPGNEAVRTEPERLQRQRQRVMLPPAAAPAARSVLCVICRGHRRFLSAVSCPVSRSLL